MAWAAVILVIALIIALAVSTGKKKVATTATTTSTAPAPTSTIPAVVAPTTRAAPTTRSVATTTIPTTAAPVLTAPTPTSSPTTSPAPADLCGTPANPYGYNFCKRGGNIYQPAPDTCTYFTCSSDFAGGQGYMEQCRDATYTMSGGLPGDCQTQGGEKQPVYKGP